ncbi:hypothetical protein HRbin02_01178 [Candidatus Calditenuaceae archaeon HR02]|nr:hypothetical protein HRbin02_01178 [Candidatus Calditenuaceae archaeon HR02]
MLGIFSLLRIDVVFEAVSLVIGLFIAVQSFRAYRVLGSWGFFLLGVGFAFMSVAMLFRVAVIGFIVTVAGPISRPPLQPLLGLVTVEVVYSVIRVVAYVIFIAAYALPRLRTPQAVQLLYPLLLTIYNPLFEIISAGLLVYLVVETAHNWVSGRPRGSGSIFAGFLALLLSHILFFLTPLNLLYYILGHAAQLVALTMILIGTYEAGSEAKTLAQT